MYLRPPKIYFRERYRPRAHFDSSLVHNALYDKAQIESFSLYSTLPLTRESSLGGTLSLVSTLSFAILRGTGGSQPVERVPAMRPDGIQLSDEFGNPRFHGPRNQMIHRKILKALQLAQNTSFSS